MSRLHQAHHKYILDDTSACDALTSQKITFITPLCLLEICICIRVLPRTQGVDEWVNSHLFYINFFPHHYFKTLWFHFSPTESWILVFRRWKTVPPSLSCAQNKFDMPECLQ